MGYLSIKQTSEKWNLSARWINDLCANGRIPGAMKIERMEEVIELTLNAQ